MLVRTTGRLTCDTVEAMADVSIRDLRNHGGKVVDRAARGERLVITRAGKPVAELRALRPEPVPLDVLLPRWRRLPRVDPARLRTDLDETVDASL